MNILVACEESQRVCTAFRKKGHTAFSCDIIETSGEHTEWHILGDVLPLLDGKCQFRTQNGEITTITNNWDMIIAFPPCTHLAVSGARHFSEKRADGRQKEAIEFFCTILNADCEKIAVENPVNIISGMYIPFWFPELAKKYGLPLKPTQRIQPYEYGDPHRKTTCLWLKGLEPLKPTNIVEPKIITYRRHDGRLTTFDEDYISGPGPDRAKNRSKTYQGIADAMASQWG